VPLVLSLLSLYTDALSCAPLFLTTLIHRCLMAQAQPCALWPEPSVPSASLGSPAPSNSSAAGSGELKPERSWFYGL
jgi:hypothetical protein